MTAEPPGRVPETQPRRHVVVVVRSFGFPSGMANTNRVRLLGRALAEQNVGVTVLCTRVSEMPGAVHNTSARGECDGIAFLYTPGTTVRSSSFFVRRYREARGYVSAIQNLVRSKLSGRLDCVYLWSGAGSWRIGPWLMVHLLHGLRVPVIVELNERPWSARGSSRMLSKHMSLLDGVSGAVAISGWLSSWAATEGRRIGHPVRVARVPIVVDVNEQVVADYGLGDKLIVYAASPGYDTALAFILAALPGVWASHPDCRLIVTGVGSKPFTAKHTIKQPPLFDRVLGDKRCQVEGHVTRAELLRLYAKARALLIPLFEDDRSRARFPTKIGEYLAAARPVVTTHVGEIDRYFTDGETAFVSPPGNLAAYAANIVMILDNPAKAAAVGLAGRRLAETRFHYSLHGQSLRALVDSLAPPARQEARVE